MPESDVVIRRKESLVMAIKLASELNYSSCNEDWRTELRALDIGASDRVLCVTGSGDRPLHLLAAGPAALTAIDLSAAQNHLLSLKAAAMRRFGHGPYVRFLGLAEPRTRTEATHRLQEFARLAADLDPHAREYWQQRPGLVAAGVLYAGRFERYFRQVGRLSRLLRGKDIDRLFAFETSAAQHAFVREVWDRSWWRWAMRTVSSRWVSRAFLRDPAFYRHAAPGLVIGDYVHARMLALLQRYPARESFMLSLIFRGRLSPYDMPPYLTSAGVAEIGPYLDRMNTVTGDVVSFLESCQAGTFTRFSLSDVPSYLDQATFERLLHAMIRAAAPGARFCIRLFLSRPVVPAIAGLHRDEKLERELELEDRSFVYRFLVGDVRP